MVGNPSRALCRRRPAFAGAALACALLAGAALPTLDPAQAAGPVQARPSFMIDSPASGNILRIAASDEDAIARLPRPRPDPADVERERIRVDFHGFKPDV